MSQSRDSDSYLPQRQRNYVTLRLISVGGNMSGDQLVAIGLLSKKYAKGVVHTTHRQEIEIPHVRTKDAAMLARDLSLAGVYCAPAITGMRAITACNGASQCISGCIDPYTLAYAIVGKYLNVELPGEIRIGIAGCSKNCLNAETNDIGIKGGIIVHFNKNNCAYCNRCVEVCPKRAISFFGRDWDINKAACDSCGHCVNNCQYDALTSIPSYAIFFGGTSGQHITLGYQLFPIADNKDTVLATVDATITFYTHNAFAGENLRTAIDRIGREYFKEYILQAVPILRR